VRSRIVISPTMIGAVTTLIVIVAVYLAYNANQGLPFVPVYRVAVDVPNAARVTPGNEVRIGGNRVGVVESLTVVEPDGANDTASAGGGGQGGETGGTVARLNLKLDESARPLPKASAFRIRYRSSFGLKYLEVVRGGGPPAEEGFIFSGIDDGATCRLPDDPDSEWEELPESMRNGCFEEQTEFDDINNTFDERTRANNRANLFGYGNAFAQRGTSLNEAINTLEPLFRELRPVARVLAAEDTNMRRFWREMSEAAAIAAPVAREQAEIFVYGAITFAAMSSNPEALRDTITESANTFETAIELFPAQRRFMQRFSVLSRELRPGVRDLRITLPTLNEAIEVGTPVLEHSPEINELLRRALRELERLVERPSTTSVLARLRQLFDTAEPLAEWVAPAQTVCNYWNYWFTHLPNALTDRDQVGHTFRQVLVSFPNSAAHETPIGGYSGLSANGREGTVGAGRFRPYELPIQNTHPYGPTGQRNQDCQAGQIGYPLGQLRVPGQSRSDPGNKVSSLPGSRGPTTLFYNANHQRELHDTRIGSRQPETWRGIGR
jgi:hypothetical protein